MKMLLDLNCVFCVIVFAHITESRIYVLSDYNDEPLFTDAGVRSRHNVAESKLIKALSHTAKKSRNNKQAILHFGRHVYHLDSFDDLTKLRSELSPDYISYDYFDINDLIRSSGNGKYVIPLGYIETLMDLSQSSVRPCRGRQCGEDHRKYSDTLKKRELRKKRHDVSKDTLNKNKAAARILKRFQIIDNRHKAFKKKNKQKEVSYESAEKYRGKRKPVKHRHKKQLSSESTSNSESNESKDSNSESLEIWKVKRDVYDSDSKSSEESESTEKPKKKYDLFSESNSDEDKSEIIFSNSIEDKPKKKRKKPIYGSSEEMRKKFEEQQEEEDLFLQGNKLYNTNVPDSEEDRRRRLPQFLPKRFHWDPSDIHELGYYWFNGPKGRYPAPTVLQ